jgi:hypothetical protein
MMSAAKYLMNVATLREGERPHPGDDLLIVMTLDMVSSIGFWRQERAHCGRAIRRAGELKRPNERSNMIASDR